jgi:hypothetical protein
VVRRPNLRGVELGKHQVRPAGVRQQPLPWHGGAHGGVCAHSAAPLPHLLSVGALLWLRYTLVNHSHAGLGSFCFGLNRRKSGKGWGPPQPPSQTRPLHGKPTGEGLGAPTTTIPNPTPGKHAACWSGGRWPQVAARAARLPPSAAEWGKFTFEASPFHLLKCCR